MEMSVEKCAHYCSDWITSDRYYKYLGVQAGDQCFCGDDPTRDLDSVKGGGCLYTCSDSSKNQLCGGFWAIQVYRVRSGFTPSGVFPRPASASSTASSSLWLQAYWAWPFFASSYYGAVAKERTGRS
ncbi:hypothetical protein EDB81DRAFT_751447 [Dactylonectria macrodidyma]|uniref:WSC domain-containing protein n=1 Tax=Dactylonectria macrodidyma TaxID=307937 RepID=A0A9P9FRP9_9HYPO|nr:hypothetical protein EDB81DRAFT_751447 [Dactylonectria macrodidyma]